MQLDKNRILQKLIAGEVFGVNEFYMDKHIKYTIISNDYTTICKINRVDFLKLIYNSDKDYERFNFIKDKCNNELITSETL